MQSEGTGTCAEDNSKGVYTSEIRLELLKAIIERGNQFRMRAPGFSMHPFIRHQDIITISPLPPGSPNPGDVVAFIRPDTGKLVVHRIIQKEGDVYRIKGDCCDEPDGTVPAAGIIGLVTRVERCGRNVNAGVHYGKRLIAMLSRAGILLKLSPKICIIEVWCITALQRIQGLGMYRRLATLVRPKILFVEADESDMEEFHAGWNYNPSCPQYRSDPAVTNFVAKARGKIVGFIQLVRHPESHYPYTGYWLFSLMVRVPYRGMGIGRELSLLVIKKAREEGAPGLTLLVNERNTAAITLYKQLHFEPVTIPGLEEQLRQEYATTGSRRVPMRRLLGTHDGG